MIRQTKQALIGLFVLSLVSAMPASAASYRVGIAPSLPEPVEEDLEDLEPESMEDKIKKGLRVKKKSDPIREAPEKPEVERKETPSKYQAWVEVFDYLTAETGIELTLVKASSQLNFELGLAKGIYDFAYVTPLQFVAFNDQPGYRALVKRKAQPLRGVVYVKKTSPYRSLTELRGKTFVFPGALDFPGSVAVRASLDSLKVEFTPKFMPNHEQAYAQIAIGNFAAGAGTRATLSAQPPEIRNAVQIIWDSPGYSPYPFIHHPRVPFWVLTRIKNAMVNMIKNEDNIQVLKYLFIDNGFEAARDKDWNEVTLIDLEKLNGSSRKIAAPEPSLGER